MYLVYVIVDENNNPFYIGQTKNLKRRVKRHFSDAKNKTYDYYVCRKIGKFLEENKEIGFDIIEDNIDKENIDKKEIEYIKRFKELGYKLCNLTEGGQGYYSFTEEQRKRAVKNRIGLKRSKETRRRMSESQTGRKFSKEHKEKLSAARKKRTTKPETRLKASQTSKGKINIKKYLLIDPDGNKYITEEGLSKFCEEHNLTTTNMHKVIQGKRKHHKGWRGEQWKTS
jgi:group I intron endonuclease